MRDAEMRAEHALIADIYGAAAGSDFAQFRPGALRLLQRTLAFDRAVWASGDVPTNTMLAVTLVDMPVPSLSTYADRWQDRDFVRAAAVASPGRAFRNEDCMPLDDYHRSAIYREYSKPNGIEHALGVVQLAPATQMGELFFLFRERQDQPFAEDECSRAERLTLHLVTAWHQAQLVHALRLATRLQEFMVRPESCALVDAAGLVLAIGSGVAAALRDRHAGWQGPLLPEGLLPLANGQTERLSFGGLQWLSVASGEHRLVCLADDQEDFGLTVSELRAARLYASGATQRQIARELGKSALTVRNQIASAYQKLGVHSKIALANRLAVRSSIDS